MNILSINEITIKRYTTDRFHLCCSHFKVFISIFIHFSNGLEHCFAGQLHRGKTENIARTPFAMKRITFHSRLSFKSLLFRNPIYSSIYSRAPLALLAEQSHLHFIAFKRYLRQIGFKSKTTNTSSLCLKIRSRWKPFKLNNYYDERANRMNFNHYLEKNYSIFEINK